MIKVCSFRIDIEKELEKVDQDDKPKGRSFVDGKEVKDIPEQVDAKGDLNSFLRPCQLCLDKCVMTEKKTVSTQITALLHFSCVLLN